MINYWIPPRLSLNIIRFDFFSFLSFLSFLSLGYILKKEKEYIQREKRENQMFYYIILLLINLVFAGIIIKLIIDINIKNDIIDYQEGYIRGTQCVFAKIYWSD